MVFFFNKSLSYLSAYAFSYKIHVFNFAERDHSTDGFSLSPSFPPFPPLLLFFLSSLPSFSFLPSSLSLSFLYLLICDMDLFKKIIYLFLTVLGLLLLHQLFSSCGERGLVSSFGRKCVLLLWRLLAVEHGLWALRLSVVAARGLRSCGSQAPEHRFNSCGAWA